MSKLLSVTTPAWWAATVAPFFAAQTPEWRAFFQTHRPWTDIGVAAICFFALKLPSKRPGAWSPC
jgi:hypothetical protein